MRSRLWRTLPLLFVFACGQGTEETTGTASDIVGGGETSLHPAVGYLGASWLDPKTGAIYAAKPFCTATLIMPNVFLTAAHCVPEEKDKKEAAALGRQFLGYTFSTGKVSEKPDIQVVEVATHPEWKGKNDPGRDIAYGVLAKNGTADLNEPLVVGLSAGTNCDNVALGYGVSTQGYIAGKTPKVERGLRKAIPMCASPGPGGILIGKGVNGSTCSGDSGGPLIAPGGKIVGVVSLGVGNNGCGPDMETYFASVANNFDFVRTAMKRAIPNTSK